jgi:DNA-binding response OmpR family regulator
MDSTKKILIVEDERPLAHALELKLKSAGFDIVLAGNGQEALDQIKEGHFDVMLLDLMMPELDGFQVLQQIQNDANKPGAVFVLSNLSQREDEERVLSLAGG